ncbi:MULTISPECIES: GyrI-like domain-containing protein [unclassified Pseudomonas]|uniref:GyrI-like domain-containing protein n=1 Tax=unclassified Pseudomonas TaxID=196821 RepID=UPI000A200760|nr:MULTISPECIES: GyrI-like domain-containing protein [unclassified Pseudomonas]
MEVKLREVLPFRVAGLQVRTLNTLEQQADTARIGPMWQRFYVENLYDKIAPRQMDSFVYGVYSNYESDASGYFDVTAGVALDAACADYPMVDIQGGDYLVFSTKGEMPECVIQAWGFIWAYFQDNPQVRRAYATDFEVYTSADSVAIYIGVHASGELSRSSN